MNVRFPLSLSNVEDFLFERGTGCWANNRCESGHLSFRTCERAMLRFWRMKTLQNFASVHANVLKTTEAIITARV